jgi:hypothetical protein
MLKAVIPNSHSMVDQVDPLKPSPQMHHNQSAALAQPNPCPYGPRHSEASNDRYWRKADIGTSDHPSTCNWAAYRMGFHQSQNEAGIDSVIRSGSHPPKNMRLWGLS